MSTISQRTVPDGTAHGVITDFATTIPVLATKPLLPLEKEVDGEDFDFRGMNLEEFITEFLPTPSRGASLPSARSSRVLRAAPGSRNCYCIHGSWTSDREFEGSIIVVAAAGDYFRVRRMTSECADESMPTKAALQEKGRHRSDALNNDDTADAGTADLGASEEADASGPPSSGVDESTQRELNEFELVHPRLLRNNRARIQLLLARAQALDEPAPTPANLSALDKLRAAGRAALGSLKTLTKQIDDQQAALSEAQRELQQRPQPSAHRCAELRTTIADATAQIKALQPHVRDRTKSAKDAGKKLGKALRPSTDPRRPLFSREDLDLCYALKWDPKNTFFETRPPEEFFGVPMGEDGPDTDWSGVLRLGNKLANDFLRFLEMRIHWGWYSPAVPPPSHHIGCEKFQYHRGVGSSP
ncbi:hypothetical protein MKEN_00144100 [Mycena kentingensis (nom. inval.)]|nr:hypothetical protein MKEN_00144100 [Mycena kentingensis (nom. inval.)]